MTFFLLKWVFNAIKRDSADDDPKFQGKAYVSKTDLTKQLAKNPELMQALGYTDKRQLDESIKISSCKKEGYLMWSEFLDFFLIVAIHCKVDTKCFFSMRRLKSS